MSELPSPPEKVFEEDTHPEPTVDTTLTTSSTNLLVDPVSFDSRTTGGEGENRRNTVTSVTDRSNLYCSGRGGNFTFVS